MLIQEDKQQQQQQETNNNQDVVIKHSDDLESSLSSNHHNQQKSIITHLLCSFVWWTTLSLIASLLLATGFWLPYWFEGYYQISNSDDLQQQQQQITFSPFRRCNLSINYNIINNINIDNQQFIKCIRYEQFNDIPSFSWKLTTLLVGLGVLFSLLVSLILLFACCIPKALTSSNTCLLVLAQFLIISIIIIGCIVYPYGWNDYHHRNRSHYQDNEFLNVCKDFDWQKPFDLETCQPSLSIYLMVIGIIILMICTMFGLCTSYQYRKFLF